MRWLRVANVALIVTVLVQGAIEYRTGQQLRTFIAINRIYAAKVDELTTALQASTRVIDQQQRRLEACGEELQNDGKNVGPAHTRGREDDDRARGWGDAAQRGHRAQRDGARRIPKAARVHHRRRTVAGDEFDPQAVESD